MATLMTALILLGFIALVIGILMFIHKRDQKKDAAKNKNIP